MVKYGVGALNIAEINDSHSLAIGRVPARSRVLDVGIGDGTVARTLQKMDCDVWGIEYDKEFAESSRDAYKDLVVGDIETIDLTEIFTEKFDVVLMLDVLEHLRDPGPVLAGMRDVLAENGFVVISLPNIAHAAIKVQLLSGRFSYTEEGLLDATHLRFFDVDGVEALITESGFAAIDMVRVRRPIDRTEIAVDLSSLPDEVLRTVVADPESETYQFVVTAVPQGSVLLEDPPLLPAMILQAEVASLKDQLEQLRSAGGRTWLNPGTIDWIDQQLNLTREREHAHQRALKDLVAHFQSTVREIREGLSHIAGQ